MTIVFLAITFFVLMFFQMGFAFDEAEARRLEREYKNELARTNPAKLRFIELTERQEELQTSLQNRGAQEFDRREREAIDRASGIDMPPRLPKGSNPQAWGDYIRRMELYKIKQEKKELFGEAFGGEGQPGLSPQEARARREENQRRADEVRQQKKVREREAEDRFHQQQDKEKRLEGEYLDKLRRGDDVPEKLKEKMRKQMDEDFPLPKDSMADLGADDPQDTIFRNVTGGYRPRPQPNPNPLPPNRNRGGRGGGTGSGKGGSGKGGGQHGGSPAGPQFGPPKPGDPMPPSGSSEKDLSGFGPPNKGGVYGPENPDGSWPSVGPKAFFGDALTPAAGLDSGPQSRNMGQGTFIVDKPVEADGYKSGPECDH